MLWRRVIKRVIVLGLAVLQRGRRGMVLAAAVAVVGLAASWWLADPSQAMGSLLLPGKTADHGPGAPARTRPAHPNDVPHKQLWFPRKTLWTAGWSARNGYSNVHNLPTVRWNSTAANELERMFREVQEPTDCSEPTVRYVVHEVLSWGFTSAMRDTTSTLLAAMLTRRAAYMLNCDWSPLCPTLYFRPTSTFCSVAAETGARTLTTAPLFVDGTTTVAGTFASTDPGQRVIRVRYVSSPAISAFGDSRRDWWVWRRLMDTGGISYHDSRTGERIDDPAAALDRLPVVVVNDLHQSVLRAILQGVIYRPIPLLQGSIDNEVAVAQGKMPYRENQQVAIVHARRTDKEDDKMPYWYFTKYNLTGGFQSMVPLIDLVERSEAVLDAPFSAYMLMSDSTWMLSRRDQLQSSFELGMDVTDLTVNLLGKFYHDHHGLSNDQGHVAIPTGLMIETIRRLLVEVYSAAQLGDYVLGSGSCGVSQLLSLLVASKHHMDPSSVAIWEEDLVFLHCQKILDWPGDSTGDFTSRIASTGLLNGATCRSLLMPRL